MDFCVIIFLISTIGITSNQVAAKSEDLSNTRNETTDLKWTASPARNGWEELSGLDENLRPIRFYQVCNRNDPDVDNWVRTRFIPSQGAKRAYIDVEFSMMKCDSAKTKNCRETFNLYYYENDKDVASSTFPPWRERPYIKIDTIAAGKRFINGDSNEKGINRKTWTLGPLKKKGFYIAAHDKGACMSLLSLRVYYYYCPETTISLATFPKTVAGKNVASLVTIQGECVNNSKRASAEGPRYHCNSNGEWRVRTGTCQCLPGFQASENMKTCQPCSDGKYKIGHGNHACSTCPRNSISSNTESASLRSVSSTIDRIETPTYAPDFCKCLPGYFRTESEDVRQPCTMPPSPPTNVKYIVNETSASIKWDEPSELGDRVDVYYNISCEKCSTDSYTKCTECGSRVIFEPGNRRHITTNHIRVHNLEAYTHYQFKISSINGVTAASHAPARYALIQVMTNQAAPSEVLNVRTVETSSSGFTVAWSLPKHPNGKVLGYEILIREKNSDDEDKGDLSAFLLEPNNPVLYETQNRSIAISDLKPGKNYEVQVRAETAAGFGGYSHMMITQTNEDTGPVTSNSPNSSRLAVLIGIGASAGLLLAVIITVYLLYNRRRKAHASERFEDGSSENKEDSFEDARHLIVQLPSYSSTQRLYVDYPDPQKGVREYACEIDQAFVEIEDTIGQGEFGEVYRGKLGSPSSGNTEQVAIKRLKQGASVKDQLNFLREACTMAQFDHPNVLVLKGVVTKTRPLMILSEYMENGALNNFLKRHQGELSILQLTNIMHGIAHGMKYLSQMQYVHRDLAARNILVNSDLICKVSDFGLSRTLENDPHATYTTQGGKIALRWTAPECIRFREFTSSSDVWSYGIVMWEVMSYGEKPYWNMPNPDVLNSIDEGYRLPAPYECPSVLHKIMIECWAMEPKQRPTFEQLVQRLDEIMSSPQLFKDDSPTSESVDASSNQSNKSVED
uniref:ephrin type-A receptor 5-like n=1 Tax=Styela clava TaxID=7725 RepID=UPI00193AA434|nr:ephrin type-A receptor 5-like [Styela clava]